MEILLMVLIAASEPRRSISGEHEYGEKFTAVYVDPEESENARDDEDFDRYVYNNSWLQYDHSPRPNQNVSLRVQQLDRRYISRPLLDNVTRHAKIRLTLEPKEDWALWPHFSFRRRDYDARALDNEIILAGVETRYRWGVRDNIRVGFNYSWTQYDDERERDRENGSVFASLEKPVTSALTLRVGGRMEQTSFAFQSASRENATRGSASVGFRYEF